MAAIGAAPEVSYFWVWVCCYLGWLFLEEWVFVVALLDLGLAIRNVAVGVLCRLTPVFGWMLGMFMVLRFSCVLIVGF